MGLAAKHPDWVFGFEDETWWSRLAQPQMHAWTYGDGEPLQLVEKDLSKQDPEPKALCCYGLLRLDSGRIWLRFVDGRPVSQVTIDFLKWAVERLELEGKRVLVLTWDNASWHISEMVRSWIRQYNQRAKQEGKVRILVCQLPKKSPWLNPLEAYWVHGKRAIVEPVRILGAEELINRVCDHFGCEHFEHITQNVS
jgi:DDE superfamily endonuclease